MAGLTFSFLDLAVAGGTVRLAVQRRAGAGVPLLFLHGFGSTKEDYADLALHPGFAGRDLIALDVPGCGASRISDPALLSIPLLAEVALRACDAVGVGRFHLIGHSMGGLTGLVLAHHNPGRVVSFFDIEGNIAPEDCFLSRQIVTHDSASEADFMDGFADRARYRAESGSALFAAALSAKVQPGTVGPVFTSMVALSDTMPLMAMFTGLPCPTAFVHGDQNRHLSYLGDLPGRGVKVIEIAQSGHFPMYSNPVALWGALLGFLQDCEANA